MIFGRVMSVRRWSTRTGVFCSIVRSQMLSSLATASGVSSASDHTTQLS